MSDELVTSDQSAVDIIIENTDIGKLVTDETAHRGMMNFLTVLQAAHLLDIFKMQSAMSEYMRLAISKLYNADRIISGDDDDSAIMYKLTNAMNFMQKYMSYAQKFTHSNQELLLSKERKDSEDQIQKLLATFQGDQLEEIIKLLDGLQHGETTEQISGRSGTGES